MKKPTALEGRGRVVSVPSADETGAREDARQCSAVGRYDDGEARQARSRSCPSMSAVGCSMSRVRSAVAESPETKLVSGSADDPEFTQRDDTCR